MINNYEIKTINNEQVLYLYIDTSTEFAKTNSKKKKTTLNDEIKNYCKKNKINFKGTKIVLMAGSLLLGTLLLKEPIVNYDDYNYTPNQIVLNTELENNSQIENIEKTEETDEIKKVLEEPSIETKESEKIVEKAPTKNTNSKTTTNNTTNKEIATTSTPTNTNNISTDNSSTQIETQSTPTVSNKEETKKEENANAFMVSIKRSNGSIVKLELEEYIIGVVAAEMPASFNIEALKAQAIAARTYAIKAVQNNIQLTDTVSTQVYNDQNELKSKWSSSFNTYYNKIKNAVNATSGLVMKYNGTLINAYYHSTSNGYTEDATYVFKSYPYLKSVESPYDKNVSSYLRTVTFSYEDISNKLGVPITPLSEIIINRNTSSRISTIIIDSNIYEGTKFRTLLGLRSTDFDFELNEDNISITTRGYGHGVGMSQYGANEYAKIGWNYNQILTHYYTGISITHY